MNDDQKQQYKAYVSYHWDMYKDLTSEAAMFALPEKSIYKTEETNMSGLNLKSKIMNTKKFTTQIEGIAAVRGRKFVVASIDVNGNLSVAANPVLHDTWVIAKQEAAQKKKNNPGKAFVYMQFVGGELSPTMSTSF